MDIVNMRTSIPFIFILCIRFVYCEENATNHESGTRTEKKTTYQLHPSREETNTNQHHDLHMQDSAITDSFAYANNATLPPYLDYSSISNISEYVNESIERKEEEELVISSEKKLLTYLMDKYSKIGTMGRPVHNYSEPVVVHFGLGLLKMDIVERENLLIMAVWARYRWKDVYLQWQPEKFNGITTVKLKPRTMWMPDIELYNTASTERYEREVMCVVSYDGTVTWFPHRIFHSSCAIDVRNFPFDNQTCHLWFGSWTHSKDEIDLQFAFPNGLDLSTFRADFKEISEWEIDNVVAERLSEQDSGNFAVMTFVLHLKRRMSFSSYILTLPVVFMSFLTLLVFWLPADSADKTNVGLTIFGSLLLLLLILLEAAPPTASAVPMLGIYYCFNIVIVMLSIFLSSLVTKLVSDTNNSRMRHRVHPWIRGTLFRLSTLLCLDRPNDLIDKQEVHVAGIGPEKECLLVTLNNTITHAQHHGTRPPSDAQQLKSLYHTMNGLCKTLSSYIDAKSELEEVNRKRKLLIEEWQHLAAILDRIFLLAYLIIILTSLVLLFPR